MYQRKWRKDNPERSREIDRKCRFENKDTRNAQKAIKRADKLLATPKWASKEYMRIWYKLAKIEEERTGRIVHVDHTVPLRGSNVCGLHCEDNMQLLFAEDNMIKSNTFIVN